MPRRPGPPTTRRRRWSPAFVPFDGGHPEVEPRRRIAMTERISTSSGWRMLWSPLGCSTRPGRLGRAPAAPETSLSASKASLGRPSPTQPTHTALLVTPSPSKRLWPEGWRKIRSGFRSQRRSVKRRDARKTRPAADVVHHVPSPLASHFFSPLKLAFSEVWHAVAGRVIVKECTVCGAECTQPAARPASWLARRNSPGVMP